MDWARVSGLGDGSPGSKGDGVFFGSAAAPSRRWVRLELFLEEKSFFKGGFKKSGVLAVNVDFDNDLPRIVSICATCSRHFVPREHGLSEDLRKLSAKIVGVRWLF